MTLVSARRSTLNPNAPLFVPAAVRQVEDFSPEWWELVTTSTWFHDYWLSQQQGEGGFFANTEDEFDVADLLPDSIDADEDTLTMESQYEQFLLFSEMERRNANVYDSSNSIKQIPTNGSLDSLNSIKQIPTNGLQLEVKPVKGPRSPVETARYWEKPAKPISPKSRTQRIQQPR